MEKFVNFNSLSPPTCENPHNHKTKYTTGRNHLGGWADDELRRHGESYSGAREGELGGEFGENTCLGDHKRTKIKNVVAHMIDPKMKAGSRPPP